MNICLVSQEYPPETAGGGIGTQTWNKAHALTRLGHTVHVLSCAAEPGPDLQSETNAGVIVHRMQPPEEFPIYNEPTYWVGYTWSVLRQLNRLMRTTKFDLIDFPELYAEGFAYQLDRTPWNWVPVAVQLHSPLAMFTEHIGWPERESRFYEVVTFMEGLSIKQADALMACSASTADFTADFYGLPRESIDVVHLGVDTEVFRPSDEGERVERRPTVLFAGGIVRNKGVQTVLEAVFSIRAKYPDIQLQIAGKGEEDLLQELRWRTRKERAKANVQFLGFVDQSDLPELYRRAHVFCSPSQWEGGVGNVYIEAMACGCPVVASPAGGVPEAVVDGETGLLVPPFDVEAVATALDRLLEDAALRQRMGEAGRRRMQDYFAVDKYILRVLATYQKAIDRSRQTLDCKTMEMG